MAEIIDTIAELRAKGWTLAALADELGVNRETVYGWVARGRAPTNPKLITGALDGLLRHKRIPKQRRYDPGSRQRTSSDRQ